MSTKWQHQVIEIPKGLNPSQREALGQAFIDFIVDRAQKRNAGKGGKPFPEYSESYTKSLDFKNAGKSKDDVNMTLSGDMLASIEVLRHGPGQLNIGFQNGSTENAKADGNIRGTYGHSKPIGPKRDFLGLTKSEIKEVIEKFKADLEQEPDWADQMAATREAARKVSEAIVPENLSSEADE